MKVEHLNILVTGCGGDISQSIGKILRDYPRLAKLIGTDIHNEHPGQFIFDKCYLVDRAKAEGYLQSLSAVVDAESIDVIVPVTEPELEFFVTNRPEFKGNPLIIRPNDASINVGLDKLATAKFLEESGLPFPATHLLNETRSAELPIVLKSRRGSGSKGLYVVKDIETLLFLQSRLKDYVAQQYISEEDGEYTCGVFRSKSGEVRSISFRRRLTGGYSGFGWVESNPVIDKLLKVVAVELDLVGSINAQLRLKDSIPYIFEINSRFSSTVLFRHLFGFEDLVWSIEDKMDLPLQPYFPVKTGSKFYKGFQEYIIKEK